MAQTAQAKTIQDPPLAKFLFDDPRSAVLWLGLRLYVGYQWISGAEHKITDPKWTVTGEALKGFWANAAKIPAAPAKPAITFDWYRSFLQFLLDQEAYTWFAKLVAFGELAIGIALILGVFTGVAAFFGGFLNWNFMMAGTASTNPLLFASAVFLVLAWKVAGHYGVDRYLLPALGTPWQLGKLAGGGERLAVVHRKVATA
jgi:thiosulfate dehydrogenase [quinone] large subunit